MLRRALTHSHQVLFGHEMTAAMHQFVRHLSISTVGYVIGNTILFAAVVLAGRWLGPWQFGQYALVVALAQIFIILMLPGVDVAVMREVSLGRRRISPIISSGLILLLLASLITVGLAVGLGSWLTAHAGISLSAWRMAVIVALALALKTFFDGAIRGLSFFRLQAVVRIIDAVLVFGVFLFGYWWRPAAGWRLLTVGIALGALLSSFLYYHVACRRFIFRQQADWATLRALWSYGRFGIVGAVGGIFLASADKLVLTQVLGAEALGLYQAYYFASVQLAGQLAFIFLNVFFPAVVRHRDLTVVLRKIDRLIVIGCGPALVAVSLFLALTLWLFSSEYERDARLILLMSGYAVAWFLYTTYWTLIASTGEAGIRYAAVHGLAGGVLYIVLVASLVHRLELFAPGIAFCLVFIYSAVVVLLWRLQFRHRLSL